jgi:hypothetical protein
MNHLRISTSRRRAIAVSVFVMLQFLSFLSGDLYAQSTQAAILGTVKDSQGAVVVRAKVTVISTDDASSHDTTTNSSGYYQVLDLKPGNYQVTVEAANFESYLANNILLEARQQLRVDASLHVGSMQQQVSVDASSSGAIDTDSATISASYNSESIQNLPANYRANGSTSPLQLIQTLPGVQADTGNGGTTTGFSIQGGLPFQADVTVDGITTKNAGGGNQPLSNAFPSGESISELRVDGVLNNAEFGQPGEVTTVSKGGTNHLHGALFWYHQNRAFDSTPFGLLVKPKKIGNDFGGTVGGPVVIPHLYNGRDKTFFFGTYEGLRYPQQTGIQLAVPSTLMKQGNFSKQTAKLANPFVPGTFYAGSQLPSISPAAKAFLGFFPDPNVGDPTVFNPGKVNYIHNENSSTQSNQFDVRGDRYIGSKALVFARYTWKNISTVQPLKWLLPSSASTDQYRILVASANYNFTPKLLNEFRFGFTLNASGTGNPFDGPGFVAQTGIQGLGPFPFNGIPELDFQNLSGFSPDRIGSTNKSRIYQYTDNLTWLLGHHTMKVGADLRKIESVSPLGFSGADNYGTFGFSTATFTGQEFADFLIGAPNTTGYDVVRQDNDGRSWQYHFYGQDDWKFSPRLTLNYGLRYEYHPAYTDAGGNVGNFDPSIAKSGRVVYPDGKQALLAPGYLASANACSLGVGGTGPTVNGAPCTPVYSNSEAGLGPGLKQVPHLRFMPRFGFAFRPFNNDKTAIRGGFGLYNITLLGSNYYSLTGTLQSDVRTYGNSETATGPAYTWPAINAGGSGVTVNPHGTGGFGTANDINFKDPYSEQWSLSIDRDLGSGIGARISYIGLQTHDLVWAPDLNDYPVSNVPAWSRPLSDKPFPNWGRLNTRSTGANASYNSMQIEVSRHFNHGLSFNSAYTWAKNLADNQGPSIGSFAGESGGSRASYRYSRQPDFGNVYGTRRNRWTTNAVYDLPFGRGRRFGGNMNRLEDAVVGGWRFSNILLWQGGTYLTPYFSNIDPSGSGSGISTVLSTVNGVSQYYVGGGRAQKADQVGNAKPSNQNRNNWISKTAFVCPGEPNWTFGAKCDIGEPGSAFAPIGRFGNAQSGTVIGPGTFNLSSGLSKTFFITEGIRLRAEGTFTNVLNHTNLNDPQVSLSSGSFGVITSARGVDFGGNRTGQVSMRLEF